MSSEVKAAQAKASVADTTPAAAAPQAAPEAGVGANTAPPTRRRRGRRPAGADTRAQILASARRMFAERGYDSVSLRAIARDAGVDPALVHHYFAGKPAVFTASLLSTAINHTKHLASTDGVPREEIGAAVVRLFIELWDGEEARRGLRRMLEAGATPEDALRPMREFLLAEVLGKLPAADSDAVLEPRRAQLICTQLLGLGLTRYVVRLPAMVQASTEELVAWIGPVLQRYYDGPLDAPA